MLDSNLKTQLQTYLRCVTAPVELVAAPAGDVTTVPYKQIIIAMGDGRWAMGAKAALGAFDHLIRAPLPPAAARATIAA